MLAPSAPGDQLLNGSMLDTSAELDALQKELGVNS